MIQAPQNYGMQQPAVQQNAVRKPSFAPSYNAVQINLDTPTLNAPPAMPYYPPVNMTPYQPPQAPAPEAPQAPEQPAQVPPPVIDNKPAEAPQATPAPQATQTPNVEVKPADEKGPEALAEEAFKGLSSADYDTQALTMESIAKKGLNEATQSEVVPYVQENIFDKLIDIMNVDTSKLPGPTEQQVAIRNKIAENDKAKEEAVKAGQNPDTVKLPNELTPQEVEEGNKLSPYEQAERNKEYAMFTTCILQKTYADELQKLSGTVPPVTELPGSKAIITTLKENPSPDMRVSAIDALRYVERPEYKDDLTTLYTIAQNDADPNVSEAATQALASLNAPKQEAPAQAAQEVAMNPQQQTPAQAAQEVAKNPQQQTPAQAA